MLFGEAPESLNRDLSTVQRDLVVTAARVFADFLDGEITGRSSRIPTITIGTDTRPTGPAIAESVLRVFLAAGYEVEWLGPVTSPEIMAYTKKSEHLDGFFYITASHNPPGYNGFKFGLSDGAVLSGSLAFPLIERFRDLLMNQALVESLVRDVAGLDPTLRRSLEENRSRWKNDAARAYRSFLLEKLPEDRFLLPVRRVLAERPLGVVAELNGSARATSVDRTLLPALGVRTAFYNDRPGVIDHQILPEGPGLDRAATLLQDHHRQDRSFQVAYVPDNDGDRGNLVFIDRDGKAVILEAQDVFSLVAAIELAWSRINGDNARPLAVVVNGPTSLRIEEIARWFDAEVFRGEVGEANMVALATEQVEAGYDVCLLGEGSNGGTIVPPATVRDPMSTLLALCKLHAFPLQGVIREARENHGIAPAENPGSLLLDTVRLLPHFTTLETDHPLAKMHVGNIPQADLKAKYEELLPRRIEGIMEELRRELHVTHWQTRNHEGTRTFPGPGNRTGAETGGLSVVFLDEEERPRGFVWMRGSGTEPVFRVLADCAGENPHLLETLITWHRSLIEEAINSLR